MSSSNGSKGISFVEAVLGALVLGLLIAGGVTYCNRPAEPAPVALPATPPVTASVPAPTVPFCTSEQANCLSLNASRRLPPEEVTKACNVFVGVARESGKCR